jgi:hypothetical protein
MKLINITLERFGNLTAIKVVSKPNKTVKWLCNCSCGQQRIVSGADLHKTITKEKGKPRESN